jgi:hypothetical protein
MRLKNRLWATARAGFEPGSLKILAPLSNFSWDSSNYGRGVEAGQAPACSRLGSPMLTPAHSYSPAAHPRLHPTHLSSPSNADKAALLTFPNGNRFFMLGLMCDNQLLSNVIHSRDFYEVQVQRRILQKETHTFI